MRTLSGCICLTFAMSLAAPALRQAQASQSTNRPAQPRTQTTKSTKKSMTKSELPDELRIVNLNLSGWTEEESKGRARVWRDQYRSVLSVSLAGPDVSAEFNPSQKATQLQSKFREVATSAHAGLIEASAVTCANGSAAKMIYKRLQEPAYVYTGMLIVPLRDGAFV